MSKIINHPRILAAGERAVARLPEAERLQIEIAKAMNAYADFLMQHDLVIVDDPDGDTRLVSAALVATLDFTSGNNACDIVLRDGPLERAYGDGKWPERVKR